MAPGSRRAQGSPRRQSWWHVFRRKLVVEERYISPAGRKALYRTAVVLMLLGSTLFFLTLVDVLQRDGLSSADSPAHSWLLSQRSEFLTDVMIVLAVIFGPVALPIIILVITATWVVLAKHAWRPLLLAGAMLTGVALAQIIGRSVGRPRPAVEQMLFGADYTFSFPSGHVLGASDFLLVTAFLVFSRKRHPRAAVLGFMAAGVGVFLAALSRLYLGYHWVSDAIASVAISLAILGAVIALDTWRTARIPGERVTGALSKSHHPRG